MQKFHQFFNFLTCKNFICASLTYFRASIKTFVRNDLFKQTTRSTSRTEIGQPTSLRVNKNLIGKFQFSKNLLHKRHRLVTHRHKNMKMKPKMFRGLKCLKLRTLLHKFRSTDAFASMYVIIATYLRH